jgi:hypothetical protein
MNNNNNNRPQQQHNQHHQLRDHKPFNDFLATNLDSTIEDRYCKHCHVKLVHNPRNTPYDKYIYSCPQCNVTNNIHNTEPSEKLVTMFPTHNAQSVINRKLVTQPDSQRLSRSKYFIQQRMQKKNEIDDNDDPYLKMLKQNNKIRITNVDYNDPTEEEYEDR